MSDGPRPAAPAAAEARERLAPTEPALEWSVNPWRRDPRRAALVVLFIVLFGAFMMRLGIATLTTVALWLAFMLALSPAFWVLRCRVDESGVARRLLFVWERRPWDRIGHAKLTRQGLFVYPPGFPSWLSVVRALWLPFEAVRPEQSDDLRSALRQRLGTHDL